MNTNEELTRRVEDIARELGTEWTGETDEHGEYRTADGEPTTASEWLRDCLDIEFHVSLGSNGLEPRGGEVAVCIGGPNIYVNVTTGEVWGAWGSSTARATIDPHVCDELTDELRELFDDYYR